MKRLQQIRRRKRNSLSNKKQNRMNLLLIASIVFIICGIAAYSRISLEAENARVSAEYNSLLEKQEELEKEQEELEDKKVYMQTKKYVEEVAREKLGLVYPGEVIFQPEDK